MSDYNVIKQEQPPDVDRLPYWDVVIIGAGPAGLAAGLTTAHRGLTTLIVEAKDQPGGQPQFLYPDKEIVDLPGFPDGITGEELSARTFRQAQNAFVQFRFDEELVAIEDTHAGREGPPEARRHQQEQLSLPQSDPGVRPASLPPEAADTRPPRVSASSLSNSQIGRLSREPGSRGRGRRLGTRRGSYGAGTRGSG